MASHVQWSLKERKVRCRYRPFPNFTLGGLTIGSFNRPRITPLHSSGFLSKRFSEFGRQLNGVIVASPHQQTFGANDNYASSFSDNAEDLEPNETTFSDKTSTTLVDSWWYPPTGTGGTSVNDSAQENVSTLLEPQDNESLLVEESVFNSSNEENEASTLIGTDDYTSTLSSNDGMTNLSTLTGLLEPRVIFKKKVVVLPALQPAPSKHPQKVSQQLRRSTQNDNNRFEFMKSIGAGAFGKVFEANDHYKQQTKVAIKIVGLPTNSSHWNGALNEITILKSLNHPNIVSYITSYIYERDANGLPIDEMAIVMEYCSNGSLMNKLVLLSYTSNPIKLQERLSWEMQLSLAIEYIHSKKIVHRDIKPENILLDDQNQIKVADVGLAKAAFKLNSFSRSSGEQSFEEYMISVKGTRPYMAPEIHAHLPYNESCDVFSLGLVFWMIVALVPRYPEVVKGFDSKYLGELLNKTSSRRNQFHSNKPTDFLLVNITKIAAMQEKILIDRMLCQDPADRPRMSEVVSFTEANFRPYQVPQPIKYIF